MVFILMKKIKISVFLTILCSQWTTAAPVDRRGLIFIPVRNDPGNNGISPESRQGGVIAGWIQNSQFFPIEVNVPDLISNAANGIQNLGQGVQHFGQNIGQGYQTWIANLAQRFPIINSIPILNQNQIKPQKYMIFIPVDQKDNVNKVNSDLSSAPLTNYVEEFTYP